MLDSLEYVPGKSETLDAILWALQAGSRVVYYPEQSGNGFSLYLLDEGERSLFRQAVLESSTEIVSLPGAKCFPELFRFGDKEVVVKSGMRFVPPAWFHDQPEWRQLMREGLAYFVQRIVPLKSSRKSAP